MKTRTGTETDTKDAGSAWFSSQQKIKSRRLEQSLRDHIKKPFDAKPDLLQTSMPAGATGWRRRVASGRPDLNLGA
jgi:hypothetical protein